MKPNNGMKQTPLRAGSHSLPFIAIGIPKIDSNLFGTSFIEAEMPTFVHISL